LDPIADGYNFRAEKHVGGTEAVSDSSGKTVQRQRNGMRAFQKNVEWEWNVEREFHERSGERSITEVAGARSGSYSTLTFCLMVNTQQRV
jgi:hypothetical protein